MTDKDREGGIGGDEPFCEHGNLLWSEDCDECGDAMRKLSDQITAAERDRGLDHAKH